MQKSTSLDLTTRDGVAGLVTDERGTHRPEQLLLSLSGTPVASALLRAPAASTQVKSKSPDENCQQWVARYFEQLIQQAHADVKRE